MASQYLDFIDYTIIGLALLLSSAFGLYYGLRSRNSQQKGTTLEYLLASRNMKMIPIAFSYFASLTSSGVIIGHPAEVYSFGLQIILLCITVVPCIFLLNEVFFPIYHRLSSGSVYEYLQLRFSPGMKNLVTALAVFQTVALSSANVYGPSTVLSQVTGISTWVIVVFLSVLCIIYTTFGGIRAVILADVVQAILMFIAMILLLAFGINYFADPIVIYERNLDTGRLNIFQWDFDLTSRQTFWNTTVGYFFTFMGICATSQFTLQRFMTAPTIKVAKKANIVGNFLFILSLVLVQSIGLVMYATFHGCDPLRSGYIKNMDQMLPAYLMKVLSSYPTLPGIIFTGILCACLRKRGSHCSSHRNDWNNEILLYSQFNQSLSLRLNTLSSVYNSTATIIMASFVKPLKPNMLDKTATFLCKVLVLLVGILSTLGVALAELFPNVLQSVLSIYAAISAPLFGLLMIGIFCPQANIKAACTAFICSVLLLLWVIAGTLVIKPVLVTKPLYSDACDVFNVTVANGTEIASLRYVLPTASVMSALPTPSPLASYFPLSSMSYLWYSAVGTVSTVVLFVVISLFVGKEKSKVCLRKLFLCDIYFYEPQKTSGNNLMAVDMST